MMKLKEELISLSNTILIRLVMIVNIVRNVRNGGVRALIVGNMRNYCNKNHKELIN